MVTHGYLMSFGWHRILHRSFYVGLFEILKALDCDQQKGVIKDGIKG